MKKRNENTLKTVILLSCLGLFFAAVFCYSVYLFTDSKNINMSEELVERAKEHLSHIAAENHALTYEDGIHEVREYLTNQFNELGVEYKEYENIFREDEFIELVTNEYVEATEDKKANMDQWARKAGFQSYQDFNKSQMEAFGVTKGTEYPITSYLIKLDAPDSDQGIMLVAHYDNAWNGNGAADDGMAIAAMLESIRTAKEMNRTNDLYFLFTDAEEVGCRGAEYFVESDEDIKDKIALVVNYEARGDSGPELLFETSKRDYGIVKEMSKAMRSTTGFSFGAEVYKHMPNGTDLTAFLENDYAGVNFACLGTEEIYHTKNDTIEHLSDSTFYQAVMGQQDIVTYFATADLQKLKSSSDAVFLTAIKDSVIVIKANTARIFTLIVAILSILTIVIMARKKRISIKYLFLSLAILTILTGVILAISIGTGYLTAQDYQNLYLKIMTNKGNQADADRLILEGKTFTNIFYIQLAISFILMATGIVIFLRKFSIKREMIYLCLMANSIYCLLLAVYFNGASYVVSVPGIIFILTLWINEKWNIRYVSGFFYAVITGVLVFPILILVYQSLRSSLPLYLGGGLCVLASFFFMQGLLLEVQENNE